MNVHFIMARKSKFDWQLIGNICFFSCLILILQCGNPSNEIKIYEDGLLIESYEIDKDSLRHGMTQKFFSSGQPFEISFYERGKLNGERLLFYENGEIEIRENYCDGMFCDTLSTYYPSGALKFQGIYNHGIMNGIVRGYYESGELKEAVMFVDNMEQGPFHEYHKNGNLKWEGTYHNGPNELGILTEYDSLGQKIKVMYCDSLSICRTTWSITDTVPSE